MTFILALVNPDQVIQISDRRLTSSDGLSNDNYNKVGILLTKDGRHTFGFAGFAGYKTFETRRWLLESLFECCPPDYRVNKIIARLRDKATVDFQNHPILRRIKATDKRLSVIFSGYNYYLKPPFQATGILTNYQAFQVEENDPPGVDSDEAWDKFVMNFWSEKRPLDHVCTSLQYVGNWRSFFLDDEPLLRSLLVERKTLKTIVNKGVSHMRKLANRKEAANLISNNLSVLILPRDETNHVYSRLYPQGLRNKFYRPDYVIGICDTMHTVISDIPVSNSGTPVPDFFIIPPESEKDPCPCLNTKFYKNCHGRY